MKHFLHISDYSNSELWEILKLAKELKTSLFMKDIYSDLMDQSKREYWKFVHTVFLIFETVHKEKNDAIINTLTSELEKIAQEELQQVAKVKESWTGKYLKKTLDKNVLTHILESIK